MERYFKGESKRWIASGPMNTPVPSQETQLMERCVERDNMLRAWKRVKGNKGSPGVDGMSIEDTGKYLQTNWMRIRQELLDGKYKPKPVRKVEIEKSGGGVRQLGIPCVIDRLVQQCILQILQPQWDPTFHGHSYGFRPGRRAHQAVCQAQKYIQEGRRWCADVDLEKFFDRVNHDILMDRVAKRVKDERVVKLIRRYLQAGIMDQGVCIERYEGTPQGGPLSPLLSNLLLDEVDWELERRGIAFVRYADDCNTYFRSERAARDGMLTLEKILGKLKLKINAQKSAVDWARKRKFLGYSFWFAAGGVVKRSIASQALSKFKDKVRELTSRTCGRSLNKVVDRLDSFLVGWKNYFQLADTPNALYKLDQWIRRRLRMFILHQWKRGSTCYRNLVARGLNPAAAKSISGGHFSYWHMAGTSGMNIVFPTSFFDELGLSRLKA
jgi:RNA-directed DNA polymerase